MPLAGEFPRISHRQAGLSAGDPASLMLEKWLSGLSVPYLVKAFTKTSIPHLQNLSSGGEPPLPVRGGMPPLPVRGGMLPLPVRGGMLPLPVRVGRPRADGLDCANNSLCKRAGRGVRADLIALVGHKAHMQNAPAHGFYTTRRSVYFIQEESPYRDSDYFPSASCSVTVSCPLSASTISVLPS